MKIPDPPESSFSALAQALMQIIQFLGAGKAAGKIYAEVIFHSEPLDLDSLEEKTQISRGGVHSAIKKLLACGLVRKSWVKGKRKDCYEPAPEILNGLGRLVEQKLWTELDPALQEWRRAQKTEIQKLVPEAGQRISHLDECLNLLYREFNTIPQKLNQQGDANA